MDLVEVFAILDFHVRNLHFVLVLLEFHLIFKLEVLSVKDKLDVSNSFLQRLIQSLSNTSFQMEILSLLAMLLRLNCRQLHIRCLRVLLFGLGFLWRWRNRFLHGLVAVVRHHFFHFFVHVGQFLLKAVALGLESGGLLVEAEHVLVEVETVLKEEVA
jgi:hypothetical protein